MIDVPGRSAYITATRLPEREHTAYNAPMNPLLGTVGRRAFVELANLMQEGLVEPNLDDLRRFCWAYERLRAAERQLEDEGRFHRRPDGQVVLNPALKRRSKARQWMERFARRLGIDPFEALIHLDRRER
jgi:P27 family predicted phage terminase small subunit